MPVETVTQRGMKRRHEDGVCRIDSRGDGITHHPVHVPRVGNVLGVAVVGAEGDPARAVLGDERQQCPKVARHGGLADQEPHPGAKPLAALLDRERLVVGTDPGRCVRLERLPEDAGSVPVDVLGAFERELLELARIAGDHAREVHHLREPDDPRPAHERLQVARGERPAGRLEQRGGDAGRRHEEHLELEARRCVVEPVHAVRAEHVRDLVRIGDHRGGPEWEHEAGELVDEQLDRLEVHVRVDEAGHDEAPAGVDRLAALI